MGASANELYEAVLALSRSIAGRKDLDALISGVATSLRRIVRFDHVGLVLHDPNGNAMQGYLLNEPCNPVITRLRLPVDQDPAGWVWLNQQPLVMSHLESETRWPEGVRVARQLGISTLAHHGTLFLDEIGEMPLELQPKLLRAIQDQEFERVGGNRTIRTDARLVAATNRDLKAMVAENRFRADLYYRLHVFPLHALRLRDRREDIARLTRYFVQKHAQRMGRNIDTIPTSVLDALTNYSWPGNIRELQNVLERSVILTTGNVLQVAMPELIGKADAIPLRERSPAESPDAERTTILKALEEARGQIGGPEGAAARLGLKRTTLQSRMRKYNIARQFS